MRGLIMEVSDPTKKRYNSTRRRGNKMLYKI